MIPSTATQLLATLVLIVPGFVFQGVLIRLRGRTPSDADLPSRIMHAIVASTIFALIYLAAIGPQIVSLDEAQANALEHLRLHAGLGLGAAFVIPALSALAIHHIRSSPLWQNAAEKLQPSNWSRIDQRPSGWDVAFEATLPTFVRVQMKDGTWYAGWFAENSYASSWPDPRTLYVEVSFQVDDDGTLKDPVKNSAGAVIDCTDAVLVELLRPADVAGS